MTVNVMVLYPNEPDAKFDMDYYLKTHMPLVEQQWGPHGLKSWEITKYTAGLHGAAPQFSVGAHLVWESEEALKTATAPDSETAKVVFGDVPKFSNKSPVLIGGDIMGSTKA